MNPYDAPRSNARDDIPSEPANPARPLLMLVGGIYALFAPMTFLSGLQAGPHVIIAGILMFTFGCGTIWLAIHQFTPALRVITIVWGIVLVAFFLFAGIASYDPPDLGGSIYAGFVLLIVTPIPILALRHPAYQHVDEQG